MNQAPAKLPFIYILSPSYSGSTLLTLLLAQHPQVATIGELKATSMGDIKKYMCSCGEKIEQCAFWTELKSHLKQQHIEFDLADFRTHFTSKSLIARKVMDAQLRGSLFEGLRALLLRMPQVREEWKDIMSRNIDIARAVSNVQDKKYFLDGSKDPQRLLYFSTRNDLDIHVIHLVRDGRAQSYSEWKNGKFKSTYKKCAKDWDSTIKQMQTSLKNISPEKIIHMRYEDLCRDPNKTMVTLFQFLNLDPPPGIDWGDFEIKKSDNHILGNAMRNKQSIKIRLDEAWREKLTNSEINIFEELAGNTNLHLGYSR